MNDPLVVMVGLAVLATITMGTALATAWLVGRRHAEASLVALGAPSRASGEGPGDSPGQATSAIAISDGVFAADEATIDRVIRVVSLLFIAASGALGAISPRPGWNSVAVVLLLAVATLFVAFAGDLLRERMAPGHRYVLQAAGAIVFLGLLTASSGGLSSPFVIGYFLLVGGAALAWEGIGPVAVALGSGLSYAAIGLLVAIGRSADGGVTTDGAGAAAGVGATGSIEAAQVTWILFVLTSLLLLAYVGTVAGRAQRRARDAALRLSRSDALTGLYNRGAFFAAVEREIKRVERMGRGFCLVMLDLDDLKPVNDTFGHPAGDQILRAITDVVLRTVRATDLAGRYGGDEFVVLLPETDAEGAFVVAEKLRRDIAALSVRVHDRTLRTSVSLGLVAYPDDGQTIEALLSAADAAMYEAKRRGKNQIVGYTTRTERVATAIGGERVTGLMPRSRLRVEESRAEEIGLAPAPGRGGGPGGRPGAGAGVGPAHESAPLLATMPGSDPGPASDAPTGSTSESIWAPPSGREEAVGESGTPGDPVAPAAAPARTTAPPARPASDDDPLDAAAPAYPAPRQVERGAPAGPQPAGPQPAGPQPAGRAVPATDDIPASVASAAPVTAGAEPTALPVGPSIPSLPARPVQTRPVQTRPVQSTLAHAGSSPSSAMPPGVRTAVPIQPRDPVAGGLPPVPAAPLPWAADAPTRGGQIPRGPGSAA